MKLGIRAFPEVEELDLAGPWELLTLWRLPTARRLTTRLCLAGRAPVPR